MNSDFISALEFYFLIIYKKLVKNIRLTEYEKQFLLRNWDDFFSFIDEFIKKEVITNEEY